MNERNNEENIRIIIQSSIEPISQKLDELIEKFDSFVLSQKKEIFSDRLANELKTGDFIWDNSERLRLLQRVAEILETRINHVGSLLDKKHRQTSESIIELEDRVNELEAYNRIEQNYGDDEIEYVDRTEFNLLGAKVIELENDVAKIIAQLSDLRKLKMNFSKK